MDVSRYKTNSDTATSAILITRFLNGILSCIRAQTYPKAVRNRYTIGNFRFLKVEESTVQVCYRINVMLPFL